MVSKKRRLLRLGKKSGQVRLLYERGICEKTRALGNIWDWTEEGYNFSSRESGRVPISRRMVGQERLNFRGIH